MPSPALPYISAALVNAMFKEKYRNQNFMGSSGAGPMESWYDAALPDQGLDSPLLAGLIEDGTIWKPFRELAAKRYVQEISDPNTDSYWMPLDSIGEIYHAECDDPKTILGRINLLGNDWLWEVLKNILEESEEKEGMSRDPEEGVLTYEAETEAAPAIDVASFNVPASDRTVPLNHNQPDFKEAFTALEKAIKEFRDDQSFGNTPPPERDRVLGELEAGRDYIEKQAKQNGEVRFGTIRELLIEPLKWIAKTFSKEAVAKLAQRAIEFLIKLYVGNG